MPLCQMYCRLMLQVQGLLLGMPMLQVVLLLALQLPQEMHEALLRVLLRVLRHPWMHLHISKHNVWMRLRVSKVLQFDVLHCNDSGGERVLENASRQRLYAYVLDAMSIALQTGCASVGAHPSSSTSCTERTT